MFVAASDAVSARVPHSGMVPWSSSQPSTGGGIGSIHWQSPIVANGCLYIADESSRVSAYCLAGQ